MGVSTGNSPAPAEVPDLAEDFFARRAAAFFALDGFLDLGTERVQVRVGIAPAVTESAGVEGLDDGADFG